MTTTMCYPRSTSSDEDLKKSFAATSHNSWFHHLQATTCRNTCGKTGYRPHFV